MACNKPKCGEKNPCKKCTQDIVVESCDKLCPFILESDCVTISRDIECGDVKEGDTLTEALEKVCGQGGGGDNCPCPVSTYTIDSVCSLRLGEIRDYTETLSVGEECEGSYSNIPLTGGTGHSATVTITVTDTGAVIIESINRGRGYLPGEVLTADIGCIGNDVTITVDTVESATGGETSPFLFTVTPHFSQTTPTYIDIATYINSSSSALFITSIFKQLIPTITENTPITFIIGFAGLTTVGDGDLKTYGFQVVDNLGNYSTLFEILDSELTACPPLD